MAGLSTGTSLPGVQQLGRRKGMTGVARDTELERGECVTRARRFSLVDRGRTRACVFRLSEADSPHTPEDPV